MNRFYANTKDDTLLVVTAEGKQYPFTLSVHRVCDFEVDEDMTHYGEDTTYNLNEYEEVFRDD